MKIQCRRLSDRIWDKIVASENAFLGKLWESGILLNTTQIISCEVSEIVQMISCKKAV